MRRGKIHPNSGVSVTLMEPSIVYNVKKLLTIIQCQSLETFINMQNKNRTSAGLLC